MKNSTAGRKIATPKEIIELAQRTKWRDIRLSSGDIVPAETIRAIFQDAAGSLKPKRKRSRPHAAVS